MATKKDIFRLKLLIENDNKISHAARTLGLRVCSWVYNHPKFRFDPEEPFPLPWTVASKLMGGLSEPQIYRLLGEFEERGHLIHCGVLGCPGKAHFKLVIPNLQVDNRALKNDCPRTIKKDSPRALKNDGRLISIPFQGRIDKPKEEISALRATGDEGGKNGGAPRRKLTMEEIRQRWRAAKEKA